VGNLAQAKQVTLTDTEGRELVCKLLNKNENCVLVSNKSGRKFTIPLINLSQDSIRLISSHAYFIPELLKELKTDDALACEYRMTDRANGFSNAYEDEYVGRPLRYGERNKRENANVDRLKILIENYGVATQKSFSTTELSLSIYGFIEAAADRTNADTIGRIIQGSFNNIGDSEDRNNKDLSWRVTRVYNLIKDYPNEAISEEITEFFNKVLIEKSAKRAKRIKTYEMSYQVSNDIVDSARRLLWSINSIESMYAF
jgi:hypothetical protein